MLASYVPHSLRTFIERTTVLARCSLPLAQLRDPKRDPDQKIAEGVRVAALPLLPCFVPACNAARVGFMM